jgi:sugar phosphate isomerase/epimerase
MVDKKLIRILSLHNFCPLPDSVDTRRASPDYYSLASIEEAERRKAVEETKHTIDTACRLKAKTVIVHSGRLNIRDKTRELAEVITKGVDPAATIATMRKERDEEIKKGYLDSLIKSIDEISEYSKKTEIRIGLENRFYFSELPSMEEFEVIFVHFGADSNIGYWHDVGHAEVFERLKLASHKEYLDRFASRLIGVHLHDVKGIIDDHKAPLMGEFDFAMLKPYLRKGILKVLEPHAPATSEDIKRALAYLKQLYNE